MDLQTSFTGQNPAVRGPGWMRDAHILYVGARYCLTGARKTSGLSDSGGAKMPGSVKPGGGANHGPQIATTRTRFPSNLAGAIVAGPGIRAGYCRDYDKDGFRNLVDVVPTIAHMLGFMPPRHAPCGLRMLLSIHHVPVLLSKGGRCLRRACFPMREGPVRILLLRNWAAGRSERRPRRGGNRFTARRDERD